MIAFLVSGARLYADTLAYATAYDYNGITSVFGTLDVDTGVFTQIATLNDLFVADLALSPTGSLYVLTATLDTNQLAFGMIDPVTGAITDIASPIVPLNSLAFSPDGTLYAVSYDPNQEAIYTIDPVTGKDAFVANLQGPLANDTNDIRFLGNTAYTTTYVNDSGLYSLNLSTGQGTFIGNTGLPADNGLAGVENGQFVGFAASTESAASGNCGSPGSCEIVTIDPATGAATAGPSTDQIYNFVTTPEPTTLLLLFSGLALLLARYLPIRVCARAIAFRPGITKFCRTAFGWLGMDATISGAGSWSESGVAPEPSTLLLLSLGLATLIAPLRADSACRRRR